MDSGVYRCQKSLPTPNCSSSLKRSLPVVLSVSISHLERCEISLILAMLAMLAMLPCSQRFTKYGEYREANLMRDVSSQGFWANLTKARWRWWSRCSSWSPTEVLQFGILVHHMQLAFSPHLRCSNLGLILFQTFPRFFRGFKHICFLMFREKMWR